AGQAEFGTKADDPTPKSLRRIGAGGEHVVRIETKPVERQVVGSENAGDADVLVRYGPAALHVKQCAVRPRQRRAESHSGSCDPVERVVTGQEQRAECNRYAACICSGRTSARPGAIRIGLADVDLNAADVGPVLDVVSDLPTSEPPSHIGIGRDTSADEVDVPASLCDTEVAAKVEAGPVVGYSTRGRCLDDPLARARLLRQEVVAQARIGRPTLDVLADAVIAPHETDPTRVGGLSG